MRLAVVLVACALGWLCLSVGLMALWHLWVMEERRRPRQPPRV